MLSFGTPMDHSSHCGDFCFEQSYPWSMTMVEIFHMGASQYGSHSTHEAVERLKCGSCVYATDSLIVINLHSHMYVYGYHSRQWSPRRYIYYYWYSTGLSSILQPICKPQEGAGAYVRSGQPQLWALKSLIPWPSQCFTVITWTRGHGGVSIIISLRFVPSSGWLSFLILGLQSWL